MRVIGYDQLIESDLPVPGALAATAREQWATEMSIRLLEAETPPVDQPLYQIEGSALVFSPSGVATYRCRTREILVSPHPNAGIEEIAALLIATALPAALWMSGNFVLHAAAVRLPGRDRALAFAGRSGGGKSTVAAALVARGAALLADDTIRIVQADGVAIASGLPGGWFAPISKSRSRDFHQAAPDQSVRRSRLGGIIILSSDAPGGAPVRLTPVQAIERLLANRHRPRIPSLLRKDAEILQFCSFLARAVPVYIWRQEPEPAVLESCALDGLARCVGE